MEQLLLIGLISITGYLVLPLSGAFRVRHQWRKFRSAIYTAMEMPILSYRRIRTDEDPQETFRFFGRIEASQGDDRLWLTDGRLSLQVDLRGVEIFTLPGQNMFGDEGRVEDNELAYTDAVPGHEPSRRVAAFPQGTEIMVAGCLSMENSRPVFHTGPGIPLLVLIYDGDPETILRRAVWSGRQRNEYWNQLTPVSLTLASFSLFILAYLFLRSPSLLPYAHISLTMSLLPLSPLLPPGLLLFALYRRIWREGRYLRAERDLISLPARRFFPEEVMCDGLTVDLPDGGEYRLRIFPSCEAALSSCGRGKIRTTRVLAGDNLHNRDCFVFGCTKAGEVRSRDPFAEQVLIPGDPRILSMMCGRGARRREFYAALFFLMALGINTVLIFVLLWAVLI